MANDTSILPDTQATNLSISRGGGSTLETDPESDHFSHLHPTPGSRSPTHPVRTIAVAYSAVGVPMSSLAPTVHSSFGMLCLKSTLTPSLSCSKAPSDHPAAPGIKARGLTMASRPYLVWSRKDPSRLTSSPWLVLFQPHWPPSPRTPQTHPSLRAFALTVYLPGTLLP